MAKSRQNSEEDRLRLIIDTQRRVREAALDIDEVMRVVGERAEEVTGADGGAVMLVEGEDIVCRTVTGRAAGSVGTRIRRAGSLSGRCVVERLAMRCDDTATDARVDREACRRFGIRSMVVVPLFHGFETVGVLEVLSGQPGRFDDRAVEDLEMLAQFVTDAMAHAAVHRESSRRATHDPLTGLPNRSLLEDRLGQALRRARRADAEVAVFLLDLDGFRSVNDTLGHRAGDEVLEAVAEGLGRTLRAGETLARIGGDEFVVVCEDIDEAAVAVIGARLVAAVAAVAEGLGHSALGVSIGAVRAQSRSSVESVLADAHAEMQRVKRRRGVEPVVSGSGTGEH